MNIDSSGTTKLRESNLHDVQHWEERLKKESVLQSSLHPVLRILMLEDVEFDAELVKNELRNARIAFTSKRVETKETFLKSLVEFLPDVILADYSLPQFSAREALRLIREQHLDIPFILVTGTQSEHAAAACVTDGADDYILKPALVRLPFAVRNAVSKKRSERDRKSAEEAILRLKERNSIIEEAAKVAIISIDALGKILFANDETKNIFGFGPSELTGQKLSILIPGYQEFMGERSSSLSDQPARANASWKCVEQSGRHKSGRSIPIEVSLDEIEKNGTRTINAIIYDLTERRHSENRLMEMNTRLRALSENLQNVREEERTRIAREIHDELGQTLTALRMDIAWLEAKVSGSKKNVMEKIRSIDEIIGSTIHMVQRIATGLRPPILDDLGFLAAAEWQAQEFERRSGITCNFIAGPEEFVLDEQRSTALFRILQETMTNVSRHAQATNIEIGIHTDENDVVMTVRDNGKGITQSEIERFQSLGILGMRERAFLVGGEVQITGIHMKGTQVTVRIPRGA